MIKTKKWYLWVPDDLEWEVNQDIQDLADEKEDEMNVRFLIADFLSIDIIRVEAEEV